jgi:hypothetical protein
MSRKIILELTEFEAESLQGRTVLNSVFDKLEEALRPEYEVLVTAKDLFLIKSMAVGEYGKLSKNVRVSDRDIEQKDFVHVSLANALFLWLNSKGLLKRLVKFDYTDDSSEYEGNGYLD